MKQKIQTALLSVYDKGQLDEIAHMLFRKGIRIIATGGTADALAAMGIPFRRVEELTGFPSILDGRVKTLHPIIFGGLLARREEAHLRQIDKYRIPLIDLVVVDLYPFEETLHRTTDEGEIIEKIDIGGIALIRAAAKNFHYVAVIPSREEYPTLMDILQTHDATTTLEMRKTLAAKAFRISSQYDALIARYLEGGRPDDADVFWSKCALPTDAANTILRYGENPHQRATFFGRLYEIVHQLHGKPLSYNNLLDIDAAMGIMADLGTEQPAFAIVKHTNPCGVACRATIHEAWKAALAGDPVSAFGGILISNRPVDLPLAQHIDAQFYEVLIAPSFEEEALALLQHRKKRILLRYSHLPAPTHLLRSCMEGVLCQTPDSYVFDRSGVEIVTQRAPDERAWRDMKLADICVKHLKSNAIAVVKDDQLIGMGCGQPSRIDACKQAIDKAHHYGFDTSGAVLASDAFFPFDDCVRLAHQAGIRTIVQPGGSIRDKDSIDFCNAHDMCMVFTHHRHFRH